VVEITQDGTIRFIPVSQSEQPPPTAEPEPVAPEREIVL
jgi:hypothetical protein